MRHPFLRYCKSENQRQRRLCHPSFASSFRASRTAGGKIALRAGAPAWSRRTQTVGKQVIFQLHRASPKFSERLSIVFLQLEKGGLRNDYLRICSRHVPVFL